MKAIVRRFLRRYGYVKCDYGFACGRHWIEIDGHLVAQTGDAEAFAPDDVVHRIGWACLDLGAHWSKPDTPHGDIIREVVSPNSVICATQEGGRK